MTGPAIDRTEALRLLGELGVAGEDIEPPILIEALIACGYQARFVHDGGLRVVTLCNTTAGWPVDLAEIGFPCDGAILRGSRVDGILWGVRNHLESQQTDSTGGGENA